LDFLLYLAIIPALGLAAQWIAWRTNLPGILLLLLFGVCLGQFVKTDQLLADLTGGDLSAGPRILFPLVSLAVAVIMFEGGLSLKLGELREAGSAALRLCTVGALITFVTASVAAYYTLGFHWRVSCLLGAILIVTGPTVIGPLLRQVRPSRRVSATLKWEGIVIDPIGAVLAVLVFEQLLAHGGESSLGPAVLLLVKVAAVGTILGVLGGVLLSTAFRKYLVPDSLHGVFTLAIGLLLFAISDQLAHESGLITVTVLGIWLTNQPDIDIEHIIEFKENLRTLLIGCLFIVLGSRVELSEVASIGGTGLLFVGILILVVRPLATYVSLVGSPLNLREQTFVACMAPRGIVAAAVSSVFALRMEQETVGTQVAGADQLATVTFLVIVGTVAVYGLTASPIAKWLGLADANRNGVLIAGADAWVRDFASELRKAEIPVLLVDTNYNKIAQARIAGLDAVCANILNEHVREDLELDGIGQMIAMTQNDEVNSLAIRECNGLFDRAHLYQLSFNAENQHSRRGLTKNLMGRELISKDMTFSKLRELHQLGAVFKRTPLTDEFTYNDYLQRHQEGSILVCILKEDKSLLINTVDDPLEPAPGQTILAVVTSTKVPEDHAAIEGDQA
jgi:CPA1 family monovalent cation:H+ antiporter